MINFSRGLVAALILGASSLAVAGPYSSIYVFGDSLSDSGNNSIVFDGLAAPAPAGTLRTPTPIANSAFIPSYTYSSNTYSNGPVWVQYFAAALGNSLLPSLAGGTNYAFGGAKVAPMSGTFPFSLQDQVAQYLAPAGNNASSTALYVVAGGGNDARAVLNGEISAAAATTAYVSGVVSMITNLFNEGARHFLVVNTPNVGTTPALQLAPPGSAAFASALTFNMNMALSASLAALAPTVREDLDILDAWGFGTAVSASPGSFGLTNITSACAASSACIAAPSTTFFWDGIHPTTAGHQLIALAALQAIPLPSTLALIGGCFVFALALSRRQRKN